MSAIPEYALAWIDNHLGRFGVREVWLIGSRGAGTARDDSDWDFFVVLSDKAPVGFRTKGRLNVEAMHRLQGDALRAGITSRLDEVELFTSRESEFGLHADGQDRALWELVTGQGRRLVPSA